ncbi:hypothetical protein HY624_04145 [Candidatus Uhrbacteria bacterium]|nr:hypothetical protein [Candidatus Uhrbacteria bacterium]
MSIRENIDTPREAMQEEGIRAPEVPELQGAELQKLSDLLEQHKDALIFDFPENMKVIDLETRDISELLVSGDRGARLAGVKGEEIWMRSDGSFFENFYDKESGKFKSRGLDRRNIIDTASVLKMVVFLLEEADQAILQSQRRNESRLHDQHTQQGSRAGSSARRDNTEAQHSGEVTELFGVKLEDVQASTPEGRLRGFMSALYALRTELRSSARKAS